MKKVIVAAAGLMLVGAMASTAMAEFKFSGDARARFYFESNYDDLNFPGTAFDGNFNASDDDTHWNSRTRLKVEADTKGGAYVKTRFYAASHTWGTTSNGSASQAFNTDYAYIGVPFGPVTVEGGRVVRDVTPWFFMDGRADALQVKYKNDTTGVVGFFDMQQESGNVDDDEQTMWGFLLNQGFTGGWAMALGAIYVDDEIRPGDNSGFGATVKVDGALSEVALTAELSFAEADLQGTDDSGWGGYVSVTVPVGAVSILGMAGFTADGFEMDAADFGPFIMLNDYSQISTAFNFAEFGDSMFLAIAPSFKASEQLTLGAQVSLAAVDNDTALNAGDDFTAWEIGATASYAVTDGAKLNGIVGYLDTDDVTNDNPFGIGLSLEISF